jgi:hypothetical protein
MQVEITPLLVFCLLVIGAVLHVISAFLAYKSGYRNALYEHYRDCLDDKGLFSVTEQDLHDMVEEAMEKMKIIEECK